MRIGCANQRWSLVGRARGPGDLMDADRQCVASRRSASDFVYHCLAASRRHARRPASQMGKRRRAFRQKLWSPIQAPARTGAGQCHCHGRCGRAALFRCRGGPGRCSGRRPVTGAAAQRRRAVRLLAATATDRRVQAQVWQGALPDWRLRHRRRWRSPTPSPVLARDLPVPVPLL